MPSYDARATIEVSATGKPTVLYEAEPGLFVTLNDFLAMKKERGEAAVKEVKKIGKKEKVKAFLKKVLETKKKSKESKKPFAKRYEEAIAKAKRMETEASGSGQDFLQDWETKNRDELEKYLGDLKQKKEDELRFIHPSYTFEFGVETGGLSGAYGLGGFVDTIIKMKKKRIQDMSKTMAEKLARDVLKILFPTATRFDKLVISALANPIQDDGGIEMVQSGKTVQGTLRYDQIPAKLNGRDYLEKATRLALS
jgi:hypothetical protein